MAPVNAITVFIHAFRLQLRDRLNLAITLLTGTLFVFLYWMMTGGGGSTSVRVLVLDDDRPAVAAGGTPVAAGEAVRAGLTEVRYPNGQPLAVVERVTDLKAAEVRLRNREAGALLVLPAGLSAALAGGAGPPAEVTLVGDLTNPSYTLAAMVAQAAVAAIGDSYSGVPPRLAVAERALGDSGGRTEFEVYVPGLFLVAVLLMLYTAALSLAREVEAGTLRRLKLTRMSAFDYLAGVTATQVLVGMASLLITMFAALAFGFHSVGPWWTAMLVGFAAAIPVVGIGLIVACFARTAMRAYLLATIPFMLLMFFSGSVFPMPKVELFRAAGRVVGVFDFLPTTHAVAAFNRVMSLGGGPGDIAYELTMLAALGLIYFGAGVLLFRRTHLRAEG
ncbi:MAG: ABC transporter permease [Deltaproteobacteria bacterium]|nr:ABC transporter permease [Deltaproteobacteria bacterium]